MNKVIALRVAGTVFLLVAIAHLFRLFTGSEIAIDGYIVSIRLSYVGLIVALLLSIWMFVASKN